MDGGIHLIVAASGEDRRIDILLPEGARPVALTVNDEATDFTLRQIEQSRYVTFEINSLGALHIELSLD